MPKSEREEALSALTSRIFTSMVDEIVFDTVLQAHHEVARSRAICDVCHTRCGRAHTPGPSSAGPSQPLPPLPSRPPSPVGELKVANGSNGTGTSTPSSLKDGNIYFECLNCQRQIASNRYATHLSSCMGIGTGTRRGAVRSANATKSKLQSSPVGRSVSPSDHGNASDDTINSKAKGKSKSKRVDEAEFNLKRKRPGSPQISPNKKHKKATGSPVSRVRADTDISGVSSGPFSLPPITTQSKVPSRLRDSSTASFVVSSSSRSTSPTVSTPNSSAFSQSPSFSGGARSMKGSVAADKRKGRASNANGKPPPKRLSPPRPPVPPVRVVEPEYLIDVEGEETGSSTDTDNS